MGDQDNLKILISAFLVVVIASLGIYAFLYRDRISGMLSDWQMKLDSSERRIANEPPFALSPEVDKSFAPGRDLAIEDEDTKNYPEIPSSDPSSSRQVTDSLPPPSTIGRTQEKTTLSAQKTGNQSGFSSPPLASTIGSPMGSSLSKKSDANEVAPNPKIKKPQKSFSKPISDPVRKKLQTKSQSSQKAKSSSLVRRSRPVQQKESFASHKVPEGKSRTGGSGNLEERVRRLEQKFQVHVQNTNSRLDSLEARIENLERKISSTGN